MTYKVIERDRRDRLGEGPVWADRLQEVVWVDILGRQVHRLEPESGAVRSVQVDDLVGWVLPRQDHDSFIAGFRDGFAVLDIESGQHQHLGILEPERPTNRLNDAKVDAWSRIWAGTKDDTDQQASGALYCLAPDLTWSRADDGYLVTNGPTFSADGRTMYHSDSARRTIFAFDFDDEGTIVSRREWLRFEDEWGYPDGMTTDAQGCLWIAHWAGARVSRFSPEGQLMQSIPLPATNITSCTFAGLSLDRMFVTSSNLGCEDEALAGALFEIDPGVRGLPARSFGG